MKTLCYCLAAVCFLGCFMLTQSTKVIMRSKPIVCKPYPVLQGIENDRMIIHPVYVKIHRCQGGQRPYQYQCQPSRTEELKYQTVLTNNGNGFVEVTNHTECKEVCVCGRCPGGDQEPFCEYPKIWNPKSCSCETYCPSVHSVGNKDIRKGSTTSHFDSATIVILMVTELIVILIGVTIWYKYSQRKKRRLENTMTSFSSTEHLSTDTNVTYSSFTTG
ncbi:uncharacterized protein [Clytia hemisphaerica]|uniref:Uncharacterized protein n=1 Tax=Clytia hemisphaerica TaxID=252671 RepID=A0A7M5XLK5_9CNID|eukprot:TCONS_00026200-protein